MEQEMGDGWIASLHPEDVQGYLYSFSNALKARRPFQTEYRLRRYDGEYRWIKDHGSPVQDEAGDFSGYVNVCHDITERVQKETALQESDERLRQLAENTDLIIWLQATDNPELLYISSAYEKISGRSCESLYSNPRSWREAVHPEDREKVLEIVNQFPNGQPATFRIIRTDQSVRWIESRAFPVKDAGGKVVRVAGVAADVTARHLVEEALRRSEERFRDMAEAIDQVFWIWTRNPHQVFYVSPAYERIFERSCQSLYDAPLSGLDAIHPDDRKRVNRTTVGSDPKRLIDITYRIVRRDGTIRWIRDRTYPSRFQSGDTIHFVSVAEDITDAKQTEEALEKVSRQFRVLSRRRAEMQEDLEKQVAIELHDQVGQAITAAKISLQSAKRLRKAKSRTEQLNTSIAILDEILEQVRRMSFDLRPLVLDDLGLVPALRALLNTYGRRNHWKTEFQADSDLQRPDPEAETTCFRIAREALFNVMRHAQATKVTFQLNGEPDGFNLKIQDDGVGFDAAEAQKQMELNRLGLVGMHERASAMGGSLHFKSAPGHGTKIHLFLPWSRALNSHD
jgi:PAS domain S-box-containing protein